MILLLGGNGSIGRRYQAILQYLELPFQVCEIGDHIEDFDFTKAIVATPTEKHLEHLGILSRYNVPVLCEKPLSKDVQLLNSFSDFTNMFVVNNYSYLLKNPKFNRPLSSIIYDFYNTGKDGFVWDCCQLVHLAAKYHAQLLLNKESPIWTLRLNDWAVEYKFIEYSYIEMIQDFARDNHANLWSLGEGIEMSNECHKLLREVTGHETILWNPSAIQFQKAPEKDISNDRTEVCSSLGL